VLYEPGGLADLERAYDRYLAFEEFRRELAKLDGVTALEVGPADRLSAVLEAGRSRSRGGTHERPHRLGPGRDRGDWPTVVSLGALVVAFGVVAGPLGLLAGARDRARRIHTRTAVRAAAGHVALVAVVPAGSALSAVVLVEAAFVLVLLVPLRRGASPGHTALVAVTLVRSCWRV